MKPDKGAIRRRPCRTGPAFDPHIINASAFAYYSRLGRVREYVESHYTDPIALGDAARLACMERTSFSKFFHAKAGVRFRDWLAYVRVTKAIELMEQENLTITSLAFLVGFQDLRTFERAFKKCTGSTPAGVKRAVRPC